MKLQIPALDAVQWALAALAVLVVCIAAWWLITSPAREAQEAAKGRATTIQSAANSASGRDAANITDRAHNTASTIENTTRDNADAIRNAPGANQPLNPDLNRVALERLCKRPSYARTEQCLQLARSRQPAR